MGCSGVVGCIDPMAAVPWTAAVSEHLRVGKYVFKACSAAAIFNDVNMVNFGLCKNAYTQEKADSLHHDLDHAKEDFRDNPARGMFDTGGTIHAGSGRTFPGQRRPRK